MPASNAAQKEEQASVRFAKDQLKAFVERIEKLEEEKKAISDDIRSTMNFGVPAGKNSPFHDVTL